MNEQQHEMFLEKTLPSGEEEWACPICGRRFQIQGAPAYEVIVLEPGDLYASHSGSAYGLRIGTVEVSQKDAEHDEISEASLRPWIKALEDMDFNW